MKAARHALLLTAVVLSLAACDQRGTAPANVDAAAEKTKDADKKPDKKKKKKDEPAPEDGAKKNGADQPAPVIPAPATPTPDAQ